MLVGWFGLEGAIEKLRSCHIKISFVAWLCHYVQPPSLKSLGCNLRRICSLCIMFSDIKLTLLKHYIHEFFPLWCTNNIFKKREKAIFHRKVAEFRRGNWKFLKRGRSENKIVKVALKDDEEFEGKVNKSLKNASFDLQFSLNFKAIQWILKSSVKSEGNIQN